MRVERILLTVVVNAAALAAAAWIFQGISVGPRAGDTSDQVVTLLLVAALFGIVNAIITPIVKLLSLPFIVLTLGLFLLVVNALMLMLTAEIADWLDIAFRVDGFWTAVGGAIVVTVATWILQMVLPDGE